jgi:hypothetical protein
MKRTTMMAMALCALAQGAAAQTVYKCSVGGKVSYAEQPCAQGKTTALAPPPAPSGAGAAAALERDKARLAALQKERGAAEAREERDMQRAAKPAAATRRTCDRLRLQSKWAEEDAARADKEKAAGARLKARRQAEALAVQCPA